MKSLFSLFFFGCAMLATGGTFTNESPAGFNSQNVEVIWSADSSNHWPENLWVYKVIPQEFSPAVISNLMALGPFTMKDKTDSSGLFALDKKAVCFQDKSDVLHWLEILPTLGYVKYYHQNAEAKAVSAIKDVPEPAVGVPNQEETTRLGLKYLRLFGIDSSQLATKPGTNDLDLHWETQTTGWNDQKTFKEIDETNVFGVIFLRWIDGLKIRGLFRGGMDISFGNHAQVFQLEICWRNLQPYELHDCPLPEQVIQWIKDGQVRLRAVRGRLPKNIRKLTITGAEFFYDGKLGNEPMDFVFPFADFTATAEGENATNNTVWFLTPLTLAKENWQILNGKN